MPKGLIIKSPWIDLILAGKKTWEIRGSATKVRGPISLIRSRSGLVIGRVDLVDCLPLDPETYAGNRVKHHVDLAFEDLPYKRPHAWVFQAPTLFSHPIPYDHPQGAVIWVNLPEET